MKFRRNRSIRPDILMLEERTLLATTSINLGTLNPAIDYGQTEVLTATVTSPDGQPAGTVTFSDELGAIGTAPITSAGVATLDTTALHAGTHEITASFDGSVQLQTYTFTTIKMPGATNTEPFGINNAGEIVGAYTTDNLGVDYPNDYPDLFPIGDHGFLDDNGTYTKVDVPGATSTIPLGINDFGQIVGAYSNSTGIHGFEDINNTFTTIDDPNGVGTTRAVGINNAGIIVGHYGSDYDNLSTSGFTESEVNNKMVYTALPDPAEAINNYGIIVLDNNTETILDTNKTLTNISATWYAPSAFKGISDSGDIVSNDVIRSASGTIAHITPTAGLPGTPYSSSITANDINNRGQIVGTDSVSGFEAALTQSPTTSTTAQPTSLYVQQDQLTVTAQDSETYGTNPVLTATYYGLANNDQGVRVNLTTTATKTSQVGIYIITVTGATNQDPDYIINYQPGTLTITKVQLTITANDATFSQDNPMPAFTYTVSGLMNGDTLSELPTVSTIATMNSMVGNYTITVSGATASNDYNITYVPGMLAVTQQIHLTPAPPPRPDPTLPVQPKPKPKPKHVAPKHVAPKHSKPKHRPAFIVLRDWYRLFA
jgi:hypothetical protein